MNEAIKEEQSKKHLRQEFFKYLLPSVSAMWVFSLYTIVDGIFVSQDDIAMAALNLSIPTNYICNITIICNWSIYNGVYLGQGRFG